MTTELSPGEVSAQDLAWWLLENGYAEEKPGFGHVTAEELAEALHKEYLIYRAYRETHDTVAGPTRAPHDQRPGWPPVPERKTTRD